MSPVVCYLDPVYLHSLFCAQVAAAIDSDNEFVKDLIESGVDNIIVLSRHVPAEVQYYIKTEHNLWHSGSETTFIEVYDRVEDAEIQWKAERDEKKITSRGAQRQDLIGTRSSTRSSSSLRSLASSIGSIPLTPRASCTK